MPHPYTKNLVSIDSKVETKDSLKLGVDGGVPIKIHKDGSIEATKLIDSSDNLSLSQSKGRIFSRSKVTDSVSSSLDIASGQKAFAAIKSYYLKLTRAFVTYSLPLAPYSHAQYAKFKFLSKKIKKIATTVIGSGSQFIFHFIKGSKAYSDKTAVNFATKIYTVPITLKFADSFRSLNDLVIVKTGAFNYAGGVRSGFSLGSERVVYVSPHREHSGVAFYKTTGSFSHLGSGDIKSTYSGASGDADVLKSTNYYYLSSKSYEFPSGYTLASSSVYNEIDASGNSFVRTGQASLKDTLYYSTYTGTLSDTKVNTGVWNGVIPAYTPFKIEVWSTNSNKLGFEGNIEVVPNSGYTNLSIEALGLGVGIGSSASDAENQAIGSARQNCLRKVDSSLVKIGAMPSGSKLRKYVNFIENQTSL